MIKIVEQPSMTSQQTREIKVLSLLDRFLKTRSYSLPTEKGLITEVYLKSRTLPNPVANTGPVLFCFG